MIRVDIFFGVVLFLFGVLAGLFGLFFLLRSRTKTSGEGDIEGGQVNRCSYCGHVFVNYSGNSLLRCPLCKSYLEVQDGK